MNCLPKLHSITVTNTYRSTLTFMDPVQVQVQVRLSATVSLSWGQVPLRAHVYCCEWLCSASKVIHNNGLVSSYQINAHFLYFITIYMLHYNPQHVSSSTLLIFSWTNCIITASGIVTLCKRAVQYAGWERTAVRSQSAYCTAVCKEWRYQRL